MQPALFDLAYLGAGIAIALLIFFATTRKRDEP